ncbi:regulatory iron-sulfur-containing complex subunit RicT [Pirellulaceae bacterium]|nr:regulatory iron-sulfur-containing complex subunit RicT [Pirellulaceae bacterium]
MSKYITRYGSMRLLGVLATRSEDQYARGDRVVVRTNRGLETGEVLREASENAIKQMKNPSNGQILRRMSLEDSAELERLQDQQKDYFKRSQQIVARLELKMELAEVEKLFGGERLIIYYISEDRVDFRELVKELAAEFQMRIEMRQIGVRDEAKLLADYGDCGKPVCCNTHLMQMPPVSMKMAKLQKATLDPTKISGRCGRLKCCLRYEYDTYVSLKEDLPPSGTEVITSSGRGKILNQEILSQQLLVELESGRRLMLHVSEILTTLDRKSPDYEEQVAEGERLLASVKTDEVEMALDSLTSDVNTGDLSEDDKSRRGKGKRRRRHRNSKGQKKSQQGSSESGAEDKKNTSGGPSSSGNGKKKRRRRRRRSDNKPSQNPEGGEST